MQARLLGGAMSTLNQSEVRARMVEHGQGGDAAKRTFARLRLEVVPADQLQAERTAELRTATGPFGSSLGDRAFIALSEPLSARTVTADRRRADETLPVAVELIR